MEKAYEALIKMEDDCREAIQIAKDLKRGVLLHSLSDEQKRKMCNEIIEILER